MASSIFTTSSPPSSSSLGAAAELAMLEAYPAVRSCCAAPGSIMDALRSVLERRPAVAPCNAFQLVHVRIVQLSRWLPHLSLLNLPIWLRLMHLLSCQKDVYRSAYRCLCTMSWVCASMAVAALMLRIITQSGGAAMDRHAAQECP